MKTSPIIETISGPIATLQFCNLAERNALSEETLDCLFASLNRLRLNPSVQVLILTGTNDVFLSGANIRDLSSLDQFTAKAFSERGQKLAQTVADLEVVTIAAINGYCMGGGLDVALACDLRIASSNAVFAHPGARLGIITGWGGTQRLARVVGRTQALDLFITARRISSTEALRSGLITRVADPVLDEAMRMGNRLVATS